MEKTQIEKEVKKDNIRPQANPVELFSKEIKRGNLMDQILVLEKDPANSPMHLVIMDTYDGEGHSRGLLMADAKEIYDVSMIEREMLGVSSKSDINIKESVFKMPKSVLLWDQVYLNSLK